MESAKITEYRDTLLTMCKTLMRSLDNQREAERALRDECVKRTNESATNLTLKNQDLRDAYVTRFTSGYEEDVAHYAAEVRVVTEEIAIHKIAFDALANLQEITIQEITQ